MRAQDHPKFSSPPPESLWWRADITRDDVRWIRQNLGHDQDGANAFGVIAASVSLCSGPLAPEWPNRVAFVEGESAPRVQIALGERYDYRREHERARRKRDPYLSAHGMFRKLDNGFHEHAMRFMDHFGPLTWKVQSGRPGECNWVRLSDFWDRHARFVGVAQLWEARSDHERLKDAWRWIHQRLDQINRVGPAPLGAVANWNLDKYHRYPGRLPWEGYGGPEGSLEEFKSLRMTAVEVVGYELNLHTEDCRQIWLSRPNASEEDITFEPTRTFGSLWGAMWDMLGQDMSGLKYGWRTCLECGRLFYPKDRRSVCCTTAHQSLWSKRTWAREHARRHQATRKAPTARSVPQLTQQDRAVPVR